MMVVTAAVYLRTINYAQIELSLTMLRDVDLMRLLVLIGKP